MSEFLQPQGAEAWFTCENLRHLPDGSRLSFSEKSTSAPNRLTTGSIDVEQLPAVSACREKLLAAMHSVIPILGEPTGIRYFLHHEFSDADRLVQIARSYQKKWNINWFGYYPRKLNPYIRPEKLTEERMYPVFRHRASKEVSELEKELDFLEYQITVHHTPQESSLLLHTQHEYSFLEEVVKESGLDVEMIREEDSYEL